MKKNPDWYKKELMWNNEDQVRVNLIIKEGENNVNVIEFKWDEHLTSWDDLLNRN